MMTGTLVRLAVRKKLDEWGVEGDIPVLLEIPRQEDHGDYSTNVAMQLARQLKRNPREVAVDILAAIRAQDTGGWLRDMGVAGPGFINLFLSDSAWRAVTAAVLVERERFGSSDEGKGRKMLLEFVSANPTGPLHVGHGRGAAVGDTLGRLLEFAGYDVTREYYVNDVGNQMDNLGRSLLARYRQLCGTPADLPEDGYKGEYMIDLARDFRAEVGDRHADAAEDAVLPLFRQEASRRILEGIASDLERFRVRFDNWFSEATLHANGLVDDAIGELRDRGELYENEGALFFRSSAHGDEKDRVLVRADGRTTYFAADVAYHRDKYRRGFDAMFDLWGADHHGYAPRLRASMAGLGEDPSRLEILLIQFVSLIRDGEKFQMSTRSGVFTTLREVLDEVGTDAARFFYLRRSHNTDLEFDLTLAKTRSSDNPVYYIQYVHARICSIFREADVRGVPKHEVASLDALAHPDEIAVMKKIARFPDMIAETVRQREPHRITFYLQDLAQTFHGFYNQHRFLGETPERTAGRLALADAVRIVVSTGLSLIGVTAPEQM
jgi:arginyl-tRNA synthetase